ncbi:MULTISPECIES: class I SAM-dependent methyltransferase [Cupriavidus]|uniref:class I SAM-dependent methyltransferase n=1 Tax=Cupriavidus sp. DF5525 TaxID=3160989 RepID=UPI0032DE9651
MPAPSPSSQPRLMQRLKLLVKPLVPRWLLDQYHARALRRDADLYQGKTPGEIFSHVYASQAWGAPKGHGEHYSGVGTHSPEIANAYLSSVTAWLAAQGAPPDVVDLGCGDFHIGSQLRAACGRYIACDVVEAVIAANRRRHAGLDVDFRCLDIAGDPLPPGDVVFVRMVLQHLDNARIASVLAKLGQYRTLVLTEQVPLGGFMPNTDKTSGAAIRLWDRPPSGVIVTAPPFNLRVRSSRVLCEVSSGGGVIRTIAYELERSAVRPGAEAQAAGVAGA